MAYGVCPYCDWEGFLEAWADDNCRTCGNHVAWDDVDGDPVAIWESRDYEHVWDKPQIKPEMFDEYYGKGLEEPGDAKGEIK